MPVANLRQQETWNGEEGRRWAEHHRRLDRMAAAANEPLLAAARIDTGDRVVDIGCGTGETTRIAARQAFRGSALGIDLSAPMLDLARRVAAEEAIGNIDFEQGDAQVHPLPAAHFDVAVSRDAADAADFLVDVQFAGFLGVSEAQAGAGAENEEPAAARAGAALTTALRRHEQGGGVLLPASAWLVTAQAE